MRKTRGFTFIEIMVVAVILVIIMLIAIPFYTKGMIRSRETVLKNNLFALRLCINRYTFDHDQPPEKMEELKEGGYIAEIPLDPMTESRTTWKLSAEKSTNAANPDAPAVCDVHSGSTAVALDGTHYAEW